MDTGSPEQVVFSGRCPECGGEFDCDADESCSWGEHHATQSYGSGETSSTSAHANVTLMSSGDDGANIQVASQMLWLVTYAALDYDLAGSLQCIFGLGPASSAVRFATEDKEKLQEQVDQLPQDGAKEYLKQLNAMEDTVSFLQGETLWQQASRVRQFSFCMHPDLSRDGTLIFNDDSPHKYPDAFVEVPASGLYWQIPMGDASIVFEDEAFSACRKEHGGPCNAIMDTGTSLIGAPPQFVDALSQRLKKEFPTYGCEADAMDRYPTFTIMLGEHTMPLHPRSYVCKLNASEWAAGLYTQKFGMVQERMPHVRHFLDAHLQRMLALRQGVVSAEQREDEHFCAPCLFEMPNTFANGEWLFGLPFFREVYTTFRTSPDSSDAQAMLFAKADENCIPGGSHALASSGPPSISMAGLRLPHRQRGHRGKRHARRAAKAHKAGGVPGRHPAV